MKKILSIMAIMSMLLLVLTGCMDINYEVALNKDGSADLTLIYGFEKEILEQYGTSSDEMSADMKEEAEKDGYTVENYSDDKLEGIKITKHFDKAEDVVMSELFEGEMDLTSEKKNEGIKIEKKGNKTVYSQNDEIDLTSGGEESEFDYSSMVKFKYVVKLPVKAGKNNATSVSKDGKTLTWELKFGEVNKIEFESEGSSSSLKTILIVAGCVVVLAVIAVVVVKASKKGGNVDSAESPVEEPSEDDKE